VALLLQAGLGTLFLLLSVLGRGTTVEKAYLILLDMQILVYFIPYVYLFVAFLIHRRRSGGSRDGVLHAPGGWAGALLIGLAGLGVTLLAMGVSMIPPPGTSDPWLFELKVAGGAAGFVALGGIVYHRARRRATMPRGSSR
jgi:amino acid transporter